MRKESLDNMKAVGITLVVISHCISFYTDYIAVPSKAASLIASLCYSVNVAIFFVIAGYLCHPQNVIRYYLKKIKSILVPFVVFSLLKIFYSEFITDRYVHAGSVGGIFKDAFLYGRLYWFIYTILIFFILAPLFWKKERAVFTSAVLVITVIVNTVLFMKGKTDAILLLQINNVLVFLPFFLTGILIGYAPKEKVAPALLRYKVILIPLCILLTAGMCFVYVKDGVVRLPRDLVFPLRFAAAFPPGYLVFAASYYLTLKTDIVRALGRYSLQIMMFDSFFRVVIYDLFDKILPPGEYRIWPAALLDLTVCLGVSVVCSKIPVVNFLIGKTDARNSGKSTAQV